MQNFKFPWKFPKENDLLKLLSVHVYFTERVNPTVNAISGGSKPNRLLPGPVPRPRLGKLLGNSFRKKKKPCLCMHVRRSYSERIVSLQQDQASGSMMN